MSFESDISAAAFAAFSRPCTIDGVDVESGCIVDRNVGYLDDDDQVRDRVTQAAFMRTDVVALSIRFGQALSAEGEAFSIGKIITDDGHVVVFEVNKS